jgi:pentatricopeptide repeat protein
MRESVLKLNSESYELMVNLHLKLGDSREAYFLYWEMRDLKYQCKDLSIFEKIYFISNKRIKLKGSNNHSLTYFQQKISILEDMLRSGYKPSIKVYNNIFSTYLRMIERGELKKTYNNVNILEICEMNQNNKTKKSNNNNTFHDEKENDDNNFILKIIRIFDHLNQQTELQPFLVTHKVLLIIFVDYFPQILQNDKMFITLLEKGFESDTEKNLNYLLKFYISKEKYTVARIIFEKLKILNNLTLNSYTSMIKMYKKENNIEKAIKLYDELILENHKPDLILYTLMIDIFGIQKKLHRISSLVNECEESGIEFDITFCNSIINSFGLCGIDFLS